VTSGSGASSSLSYGGSTSEAMHHRSFYLDHDDTQQWMKAVPRTNQ
jgi:hypothetical protein